MREGAEKPERGATRFMSSTSDDLNRAGLPDVAAIAHPLDEFYARSELRLPPLDQVDGEAVPEPYRTLLVHERDMTSTLENFHKAAIHLCLVSRQRSGDEYFREVV